MGLNDELQTLYAFFEDLALSEEYYRLKYTESRRLERGARAFGAVTSAAAGVTAFGWLAQPVAICAFVAGLTPFAADIFDFSGRKLGELEFLWRGYKTRREQMQREVLDELVRCRSEQVAKKAILPRLRKRHAAIEQATLELSVKDEAHSEKLREQAMAVVQKRYPRNEYWYWR